MPNDRLYRPGFYPLSVLKVDIEGEVAGILFESTRTASLRKGEELTLAGI
jgi:hypothetical protein